MSAKRTQPAKWISLTEAADLLGVDRSTVYRSLINPEWRAKRWGDEGKGWRLRPLVQRPIYEVSRERAEQLAKQNDSA